MTPSFTASLIASATPSLLDGSEIFLRLVTLRVGVVEAGEESLLRLVMLLLGVVDEGETRGLRLTSGKTSEDSQEVRLNSSACVGGGG